MILRLVCDTCGFIAQFETLNSEPLTATTDIPAMVERAGWRSIRKIGSSFAMQDTCPTCVARERR
jgi:hypothetical protein